MHLTWGAWAGIGFCAVAGDRAGLVDLEGDAVSTTMSSSIVAEYETVPVRRKAIQWIGDNLAQVQNFVGVDTDLRGRDHQMFVHPLPAWLVEARSRPWKTDWPADCDAALLVRNEDSWKPVHLNDWIVEYDHGHQVLGNDRFQQGFRKV